MRETDFYQQILGLQQPWFVADVKLDTVSQQVDVNVEHPENTAFCCPECGKQRSVYDHPASRHWRHLDKMQFRTVLHAKPPRVKVSVLFVHVDSGASVVGFFPRLGETRAESFQSRTCRAVA
jgi:transposase